MTGRKTNQINRLLYPLAYTTTAWAHTSPNMHVPVFPLCDRYDFICLCGDMHWGYGSGDTGTWGVSVRCCGASLPQMLSNIFRVHYIICSWGAFEENTIKIFHYCNWYFLFGKLRNIKNQKAKLPKTPSYSHKPVSRAAFASAKQH